MPLSPLTGVILILLFRRRRSLSISHRAILRGAILSLYTSPDTLRLDRRIILGPNILPIPRYCSPGSLSSARGRNKEGKTAPLRTAYAPVIGRSRAPAGRDADRSAAGNVPRAPVALVGYRRRRLEAPVIRRVDEPPRVYSVTRRRRSVSVASSRRPGVGLTSPGRLSSHLVQQMAFSEGRSCTR